MSKLFITFLTIILCACSGENNPGIDSKIKEESVATSSMQAVTASKNATLASSAEGMLDAFHKDIEACHSVTELLKEDRSFINVDYSTPQPEPLEVLSLHPQYANSESFSYILKNRKYFDIGIANMEIGNPLAEAWVDNDEHIFCQLTKRRLDEIELLGESSAAWEIREYFLNKILKGLLPITSLMGDAEVESEWLKSEAQEASLRYLGNQRPKFIAWVERAIIAIEKERSEIKADDVFSIEWQQKILDGRLSYLKDVIAHEGPIAYPNPNPLIGTWKSQSDRITFDVYKHGTYYRNNEVCFEFSYLLREDELLRVGDKPDVCNLGLIARYRVSIAHDTLMLKNFDSQLETNWERIHEQNSPPQGVSSESSPIH